MSVIQRLSGQALPQSVILVVGNLLELKVIPARGERLTDNIAIVPATIARVEAVNHRIGPHFSTFSLRAVALGAASLTASSKGRRLAGPIGITVVRPIALPAENTKAGILARLLLAESYTPMVAKPDKGNLDEGMLLMRVVAETALPGQTDDGHRRAPEASQTWFAHVINLRGLKIIHCLLTR